jgi:hypothetical protein
MPKTLHQILGGRNLCGVIERIKPGIPMDILPAGFSRVTRTIKGHVGTYFKVTGTRKTAKLATYGSPSKTRELTGVEEMPITLFHTIENISHKAATLMNLKSLNDQEQRLGEAEIARQTAEFKQLFTNLRMAAVLLAIANGEIYYDADGNLLASDTALKVDFGVPAVSGDGAGNKGALAAPAGTNSIIGPIGYSGANYKWSTAGTGIHLQLKALKKVARKLTGYPLRFAFYGENILDYFLKNTVILNIMNRNAKIQDSIMSGEIPDGFLGLNWIDVSQGFFEDDSGVNQEIFDPDTVVFTPAVDRTWYELIDGTYPVPTNIGNLAAGSLEALKTILIKAGMFSYAKVTEDPVGIKQVSGDTFLPVIKVPASIFIAKVHY